MSGTSIPTESRIFAAQSLREIKRREAVCAGYIVKGATTWGGTLNTLFGRLRRIGSSVQQAALLRGAIARLDRVAENNSAYIKLVNVTQTKRTSGLALVTFGAGAHPIEGINEEGLGILQHVLGLLVRSSGQHVNNRVCLRYRSTLCTGIVRIAMGLTTNDKPYTGAFLDVRTVLGIDQLHSDQKLLLEQGELTYKIVREWLQARNLEQISTFAARIPSLPQVEDDFVARSGARATDIVRKVHALDRSRSERNLRT